MMDIVKLREKIQKHRERATAYKRDSEPRSRKYDYFVGQEEAFIAVLNLIDSPDTPAPPREA
jgi:hypothetical protein